jgi:EAL domain-containing protein (putative c-di-GMP-specific phosphodiesterase class I)
LKVDKAFVDGVGDSPESGALAETIIQLGHTLHLETVAEGIEQPRQADGLRALGCRFGQGFYFDRALPAREIEELISQQSSSELLPLAATTTVDAPPEG